jgi:hypothetical protein
LSKILKCTTALLLILLVAAIPSASILIAVNAQNDIEEPSPFPTFPPIQDQARVIITATIGGTTSPAPGQYTYPNATQFQIRAIPDSGFRFANWVISGENTPGHNLPPVFVPEDAPEDWVPDLYWMATSARLDSLTASQNPLDVICGYGNTYQYQAVFVAIAPAVTPGNVIIFESLGGTSNPGPGTYTYVTDAEVTLTATPNTGFEFQHWVISGGPIPAEHHGTIVDDIITDNPVTTHAVSGYSYNYQPVFSPVGFITPPTGIPVEYLYAAIVILVIIAIIGIGIALMYRKRRK